MGFGTSRQRIVRKFGLVRINSDDRIVILFPNFIIEKIWPCNCYCGFTASPARGHARRSAGAVVRQPQVPQDIHVDSWDRGLPALRPHAAACLRKGAQC